MKHNNSKKPHLKTSDMIVMYQEGLSTKQIADKIGVFKTTVRLRLKKAGITLRLPKEYNGSKRYWLWKGKDYIDPITRKRNQLEHRKWSHKVQERDNHTCQDCGVTNVRLHAHHIVSLKECINSELEFDVNNGITLCPLCHKHRHKEQMI